MDIKWLEDFLAVAECRSFTRAARQRNTSQSGLSRRIQSLEHWVGASLVDRQDHPLGLTLAGQRFLPLAASLRSSLVAARQLCQADASPVDAPVTLAVAEGLESGVLPMLLSRLRRQGFTAPVRVAVRGLEAASAALLEGAAEFWLAPQHERLPLQLDPAGYEGVTVAHDRLSPIVGVTVTGRPLHTLPGTRAQPTPLIEYGGADDLARIAGMQLADASLRAHVRTACAADSLHSVHALTRQGLGVAFLPESMVRDELRRGELAIADARWCARLDIRLVRARSATARGPVADAARDMWDGLASRESPACAIGVAGAQQGPMRILQAQRT
jgi:DNA-binding transcriptional LysR family regulator